MSLSEQRIVFEGAKRSHSMRLLNNGPEPIVYRIALRAAAMQEDGRIEFYERDHQPEHSAGELIKFSPRKGALASGQSQVVRFKLKKYPDLAKGEYYSFVRVLTRPATEGDSGAPQFSKQMAYNIPVFVRQGNLREGAGLVMDQAVITQNKQGQWQLGLRLQRQGGRSIYGEFDVSSGGQSLAFVKGISVYPNINQRYLTLPLSGEPEGDVSVSFVEHGISGNLETQLKVPYR